MMQTWIRDSLLALFLMSAAMPAGTRGAVRVLLSSRSTDVWRIKGDGGAAAGVTVPHIMNEMGRGGGTKGYDPDLCSSVFTYERRFMLPPEIEARPRKFLRFHRANWRTTVYVNGQKAGVHDGGFHTFDVDITSAVRPGRNHLRVVVEDYHCLVNPGKDPSKDPHVLLGLVGGTGGWNYLRGLHDDVYLMGRHEIFLGAYYTWGILRGDETPRMQEPAVIHTRTDVCNTSQEDAVVRVVYTYKQGEDLAKVVKSDAFVVTAGGTRVLDTSEAWRAPRLWWPHDPFLYDVTVALEVAGGIRDSESFQFGFRDFYTRRTDLAPYRDRENRIVGDMWLNGRRMRLRSDSMGIWQAVGAFTDEDGWSERRIAKMFLKARALHINAIRFHATPVPGIFYRVADRIGMILIAESPFHGSHRIGRESFGYDFGSPAFWRTARRQLGMFAREHRQYASNLLWSAENEVWRLAPKRLKHDARFLANVASMFGVFAGEDPARDVAFEGDHHHLFSFDERIFIYNGHYINGDGVYRRTELPRVSPWVSGHESLRRANDRPFAVGEFFWAGVGDRPAVCRAQVYGGFQVSGPGDPWSDARKKSDARLVYDQVMNYRTFRNWDHFGFFSMYLCAGDKVERAAGLKAAYRPIVIHCRNHNDAFFAGEEIVRDLVVMNDTLEDRRFTCRVSTVDAQGKTFFSDEESLELDAGELLDKTIRFRAPEAGAPFVFRYGLWEDGQAVDRHDRVCHVRPKTSFSVRGSLYYLADDPALQSLAADIRGLVHPIATFHALAAFAEGALLLREHTDVDAEAVRSFLDRGGAVLYLASDPAVTRPPDWMDLTLEFPMVRFKGPYAYSIAFKDPAAGHAVADALIDTDLVSTPVNTAAPYGDLRFWGNGMLIASKCITLVRHPGFEPVVRATDGRDPGMTHVLLARIRQGRGTVWFSTLLLLEKYREAPQAAKILGLLLENLNRR